MADYIEKRSFKTLDLAKSSDTCFYSMNVLVNC
jgi:hypothetical protein